MNSSRTKWMLLVVLVAGLWSQTRSAHAQAGNWHWGSPGFTATMTNRADVNYILVTQGIADPNANYWTPFWQMGHDPNVYTGVPDTGYRNTFAVNHDINASAGIPILGYLDIFTPLLGTNELAIASTVASIWNGIVSTVSSVWSSITSLFSNDYSSYSASGGYAESGWDNAFDGGYGGYDGGGGGGCFVAGTPVTMADGSTRPIESVHEGDLVLSYDTKSRQATPSRVTATFVHDNWRDRVATVLINGTLRATVNHPFFVNGRWVRADRIKAGDTLVQALPADRPARVDVMHMLTSGAPQFQQAARTGVMAVQSVQRLSGADVVFNLEVATYHDFFSGGVLVHNLTAIDCY